MEYTYEIVLVDKPNKCLEVRYMSEGLQTVHVGVRYPNEGETVEDVIKQYAPTILWVEESRKLSSDHIAVGQTGKIGLW